MKKGDKCKIYRGPLSGMECVLVRHDNANSAWYAMVGDEKMLVYDYELLETIERPERKRKVKK